MEGGVAHQGLMENRESVGTEELKSMFLQSLAYFQFFSSARHEGQSVSNELERSHGSFNSSQDFIFREGKRSYLKSDTQKRPPVLPPLHSKGAFQPR